MSDAGLVELDITSLAAGGDGVARDADGRVVFVPRAAPGDRLRVRIVESKKNFARAEIVAVVEPSSDRVEPPCPHFLAGCGGCQWQHVARPAQLAAKQAIVVGALRKLAGLVVHSIEDPAPAYGWRRRARFHAEGGRLGLYILDTHVLLPIDSCPQLEPRLSEVLAIAARATPADGEVSFLVGHRGDVGVHFAGGPTGDRGAAMRAAGIRNVAIGPSASVVAIGDAIEVEPGLNVWPWAFAQASAAGNAALIARSRAALGPGPGSLLELYAGGGNLTRGFLADGWRVVASDLVEPADYDPDDPPPDIVRRDGPVVTVLADIVRESDRFEAIVLDPPRTGAAGAIDGIAKLSPRCIVYVSCDPATLARDAERLVAAGYRATDAWPIDLMPQTSHVEVVLRFER